MALADIYQKATLVQIPSGYKAADAELYSVVPNTTAGDFTVSVDADATRVNKDGLIESVAANQARLDYNPSNPQDPTLLLEPSRTNAITQSQELTSGSLAKVNLTVADNTSIVEPQGGTNAKTLTATSTIQPRLEWRGTAVPASNTSYAMSFWVRYNTARYVAIAHFSQTGEYAIFDLVDGEVENDVGTQTAKIEAYKNGWYRISKSFQVPSSASLNYWKFTLCTQTNAFVGVSGEKADVFGLQLEEGSYPTSYIPTSGSVVTRTVDTCNIANYTNLPTDYPLTVYWKGQVKEFNGFNCAFSIYQDGASGGFLTVSFNTSSQILVRRAIGGSEDVDFISHSYSLGDVLKIGIKFTSATTFKLFIDGLEIYEETSGVSKTWDFNSVLIGQLRVSADTGNRNPCDALMLFNEALSDSELQTLTS